MVTKQWYHIMNTNNKSFTIMIMMPLTISITEGIAFGFIAFTLLKLVAGRGDEVNWVVYLFTVLFIIRYLVLV